MRKSEPCPRRQATARTSPRPAIKALAIAPRSADRPILQLGKRSEPPKSWYGRRGSSARSRAHSNWWGICAAEALAASVGQTSERSELPAHHRLLRLGPVSLADARKIFCGFLADNLDGGEAAAHAGGGGASSPGGTGRPWWLSAEPARAPRGGLAHRGRRREVLSDVASSCRRSRVSCPSPRR